MIRAPSVMRSKSRPVSIITTNTAERVRGTASATTMPTRKPRATRLTTITTESAVKNFTMNSWIASSMTLRLVGDLGEGDAGRQLVMDRHLLGVEGLAQR